MGYSLEILEAYGSEGVFAICRLQCRVTERMHTAARRDHGGGRKYMPCNDIDQNGNANCWNMAYKYVHKNAEIDPRLGHGLEIRDRSLPMYPRSTARC